MEIQTVGRPRKRIEYEVLGELTLEDLEGLGVEKGLKSLSPVKRISDRHHALARCIASGVTDFEASVVTGYCLGRIRGLKQDPAFKELVTFYRGAVIEKFADLHERLAGLAVDAADLLRDRMEDSPEEISTGQLTELVKMGADRTGHGPSNTTVNVNIGLASRLEAARKRVLTLNPSEIKDDSGSSKDLPSTIDIGGDD